MPKIVSTYLLAESHPKKQLTELHPEEIMNHQHRGKASTYLNKRTTHWHPICCMILPNDPKISKYGHNMLLMFPGFKWVVLTISMWRIERRLNYFTLWGAGWRPASTTTTTRGNPNWTWCVVGYAHGFASFFALSWNKEPDRKKLQAVAPQWFWGFWLEGAGNCAGNSRVRCCMWPAANSNLFPKPSKTKCNTGMVHTFMQLGTIASALCTGALLPRKGIAMLNRKVLQWCIHDISWILFICHPITNFKIFPDAVSPNFFKLVKPKELNSFSPRRPAALVQWRQNHVPPGVGFMKGSKLKDTPQPGE